MRTCLRTKDPMPRQPRETVKHWLVFGLSECAYVFVLWEAAARSGADSAATRRRGSGDARRPTPAMGAALQLAPNRTLSDSLPSG